RWSEALEKSAATLPAMRREAEAFLSSGNRVSPWADALALITVCAARGDGEPTASDIASPQVVCDALDRLFRTEAQTARGRPPPRADGTSTDNSPRTRGPIGLCCLGPAPPLPPWRRHLGAFARLDPIASQPFLGVTPKATRTSGRSCGRHSS